MKSSLTQKVRNCFQPAEWTIEELPGGGGPRNPTPSSLKWSDQLDGFEEDLDLWIDRVKALLRMDLKPFRRSVLEEMLDNLQDARWWVDDFRSGEPVHRAKRLTDPGNIE
jgi:hypothetical protein